MRREFREWHYGIHMIISSERSSVISVNGHQSHCDLLDPNLVELTRLLSLDDAKLICFGLAMSNRGEDDSSRRCGRCMLDGA